MELTVFASAVLYIAVFLLSAFLARVGQTRKLRSLKIFAIVLPILLVGLRLHTGTDTDTYRAFYVQVGNEDLAASISRFTTGSMEPIIVLLSRLGAMLHLDASFVFLVFAAITIISLYFTTRNLSKQHAWLYYGMLLFLCYPESLNIMRQMAAVSVQALALSYIIKRTHANKPVHVVGVILLALLSIGLHYSSILLIPALFLPLIVKHIRGRTLFVLMAIAVTICLFALPQVLNIVSQLGILPQKHLDTFLATPGSIINVKFFAATILTGVFFANYFRRRDKKDKEYGFLMMLGMIYSGIGFYSGYVGRMATFFWVFIIIAIVNLINQLFKQERDKLVVNSLIAVSYFVLYFVVLGFDEIIPYSFIIG